jgi:hypothetical protein
MEHRTKHRSRQTAERHLTRQGFERHPLTGVWRHRGKRLTARIEINVAPCAYEIVYAPY